MITEPVDCKYIEFQYAHDSESGKTRIWDVVPKDEHLAIGQVRWFGRWRKYAFFPWEDTVYEQTCLRDIADFCEGQTKAHRSEPNDY